MRSILYTSAVNTKRWTYYTRYGSNGMNRRRTPVNWACYSVKLARLLRSFLPAVDAPISCSTPGCPQSLQPIRTRRLIRTRKVQIREVWDSIRSRNQHRPAVSTPASAFVVSWDIGRFIILICRYLRGQNSQQSSQQGSHFRRIYLSFSFSHIFCFRIYLFTFIAFAMEFSASVMARQVFGSSSMDFFAMPIGRRNGYSLRDEAWRRGENSVTSMPWKKFRLSLILSSTRN